MVGVTSITVLSKLLEKSTPTLCIYLENVRKKWKGVCEKI